MKKSILTLLLIALTVVAFGQQWNAITSSTPSSIKKQLVASTERGITVNVQVGGFYTTEVTTPRGVANIVSVPRTVSTALAGEPNLPMIAIPAIIGDNQHYSIRVIDAQYQDFNLNVAPSKGDFSREINPEDVPYTYGEAYSQNAFFPTSNIGLYEPYILRDFRGQNMVIYPFAYNPATQTLRVYHNMTVEMYSDGMSGENQITRKSNSVKMDPEISALYENQFINYEASLSKYTPIEEEGDLLIICHDAFMDAMEPFVNWKRQTGRQTTMVGTSVTGTTDSAIKAYIEAQYNANSNLTHILLVGDAAQIPGHYMTASGGYGGKSDLWYGKKVNILYNTTKVDIYHKFECVASHERSYKVYGFTTISEHLPKSQKSYLEWDPEKLLNEGEAIHPDVKAFMMKVLESKRYPEQAYKSLKGILALAVKVGEDRLAKACRLATILGVYSYQAVENILANKQENAPIVEDAEEEDGTIPEHENLRGKEYYK